MKNKLLPLFALLGCISAYSQVGVGKIIPNPSAMLEVNAINEGSEITNVGGMLIPRVSLKSSTDTTTITKGNVNSLLVFNTETISDITPGYYYWYIDRWNRMAISGEAGSTAGGNGTPGNKGDAGYPGAGIIVYTDYLTGDVYVQNPDGTWTKINGKDGAAGVVGVEGMTGSANFIQKDSTARGCLKQAYF